MADPSKPDQTFPKCLRVVKGDHFSQALRGGGCAADGTLVLFALPREVRDGEVRNGEMLATRLGVTIPKKTGNAVVRNQWKRIIREAFRIQKDQMPTGYDLIVRPKKDAVLDGKSIRTGLPKLASRAVKRVK